MDTIDWAPKVPPYLIHQLYQYDASGIPDPDLLQKVVYALAARCRDILEVSQAIEGTLHCRACGQPIQRLKTGQPDEDQEILRCAACAWNTTWAVYFQSFTGRQLRAGEIPHIYRQYLQGVESAQTPQQKMLAIDRLIHEFHTNLGAATKPVAVTVIAGGSTKVRQLIETLAYGASKP